MNFFAFSDKIDTRSLSFPVKLVLSSRSLPNETKKQLSPNFLNILSSSAIDQVYLGSQNYSFLSEKSESDSLQNDSGPSTTELHSELTSGNFDTILKQIIENKLKFHKRRTCIFLSSVTAATVSAASSAIRGKSPWLQENGGSMESKNEPDSVVFTCNHNFPRYYVEDVILPEFSQRVQGLPKPLPETAEMLIRYYTQKRTLIPAACPCCVYNNLRQEQLHLLQETGSELSGKSPLSGKFETGTTSLDYA